MFILLYIKNNYSESYSIDENIVLKCHFLLQHVGNIFPRRYMMLRNTDLS